MKKVNKNAEKQPQLENAEIDPYLMLGHHIKYNLYLNAKATVFAAILQKYNLTPCEASIETHKVLNHFAELDHGQATEKQQPKKE